MRKILLNAAMLLGALLLFVPLSKAEKITLTVKKDASITAADAYTTNPALTGETVQVDKDADVTFTFKDAPATGKMYQIKAKEGQESKVTVGEYNATDKTIKVTVKEAAEVTVSLVAAPAKITLTVKKDASITAADAYTTNPALTGETVQVDKDADVTFTFKDAPATGKMYQIKAKEGQESKVTVGEYNATDKTIKVTVKEAAEVTVSLVAAPAKVTLTVKDDKSIKADAYTTTPALATGKVEVDKDAKVVFTFKAAPEAGKMYQIKATKDTEAAKVVVGAYDATKKTIEVTVKETVEVTVAIVPAAAKVTLTVTNDKSIKADAYTTTPALATGKVEVDKDAKVVFTFKAAPEAGKMYQIKATKDTEAAKVVVGAYDATKKTIEVTVKETVEVTVAIVPAAPAASIVELAGNAKDADVKAFTKADDGKFTKETKLEDLKADQEFVLQITAKEKEITKVEVKVGDDAAKVLELKDNKYTSDVIKVAAGKKVVVTVTTKEPAAGALLVVKPDQGVTVKVEVAGKEVTDFSTIKPADVLTITVKAPADKPVVTVTATEEGGQPKVLELKDGKYTHTMDTKKTTLTVTAKTPAEDAVLAAVAVYPNPFVGQLFVANTAEVAKVALVNAQGVVVRTVLPAGANELNIAVEDLPAGVYVLVLEREGARKAIRLVK